MRKDRLTKFGRIPIRPPGPFQGVCVRGFIVCIVLLLGLAPSGLARAASIDEPRSGWKIGYWVWETNDRPYAAPGGLEADLLYVQVGSMRFAEPDGPEKVRMRWPRTLPKSPGCFALLRVDDAAPPSVGVIPMMVAEYRSVKAEAARAGRRVVGFQMDYDCPTRLLGDYALFLDRLREALPPDDLLSITALLDWFGPGTALTDLLRRVDEFVPQFYDTGQSTGGDQVPGIAAPLDASRWAPLFNATGRPYRIGISVFGRLTSLRKDRGGGVSPAPEFERYVVGSSPLELMRWRHLDPTFRGRSAAGETVLRFDARPRPEGRRSLGAPGAEEKEAVKMTIPTAASFSAAYQAARTFGGSCSGVILFRWPSAGESMILSPEEVERVLAGDARPAASTRVEVEDGFCAAVHCSNLLVRLADRFPEKPVTLRLRASTDLDYFLPAEGVRAALKGGRIIEVRIPAFAGAPAILVGRAVSTKPATFVLEEKP